MKIEGSPSEQAVHSSRFRAGGHAPCPRELRASYYGSGRWLRCGGVLLCSEGAQLSRKSGLAPQQVTRLLREWSAGEKEALDQLMALVYSQLRMLAARCLAGEKSEQTLRATPLMHEACMRLVDCNGTFNDRVHFFAVAARQVHHIRMDHARAHNRQKQGGGAERLTLDEAVLAGPAHPQLLDRDEALKRLAARNRRKSEIVEFLFFSGLSYMRRPPHSRFSAATVHRELTMAKAWLYRELV